MSSAPDKAIRVVMIIKDADAYKGSAVQMRHLAAALVKRGVDVQVLAKWCREPKLGGAFPDERIVRLQGKRSRDYYREVESWLTENAASYDVIHVHGHGTLSMAASRAARHLKKPLLVKITSAGAETRLGSWQKWARLFPFMRSRFVAHSDYWVSISSETMRGLLDLGVPEKSILTIPNGVDSLFAPLSQDARTALRQELGIKDSETVVVTIGNLKPHKHIDWIVKAFASATQSSEHSKRARLWIIGDGQDRATLENQVATAQLEGVTFTGSIDRQEVSRRLQCADIFVLASQNEGLSNALLESMACGVTPLCARISGNEDVVSDGQNGVLYPADDEGALAKSLETMIEQPERVAALGVSARAVAQKYDLANVAAQYENAYRQIMGSPL